MVQGVGRLQTKKERCAEEYRKFLELKNRLHDTARQFLRDVQRRMPAQTHEPAERIVKLIIDDWQRVRPHVRAKEIGFDSFSWSVETFNPGDWSDVDAARLHSALLGCGEAFEKAHQSSGGNRKSRARARISNDSPKVQKKTMD
jgi:hypothetical protein